MAYRDKVLWSTLGALLTLTLIASAVLAFSPHRAAASPSITNFQVNQVLAGPFTQNMQNEPSLAQNPANPLNLIAGANDDIGEPPCTVVNPYCPFTVGVSGSGYYASFDGGKTWPCQGLINLSGFSDYSVGDPAQAFDSRGNAYYGGLSNPNPLTNAELATGQQADFFIAKSTDGGCTYPQVAKVSGNAPAIFNDKDAIAADASPNSPFRDNVYAAWTKFTSNKGRGFGGDQILFARSTDGGKTFSSPQPISPDYNNNAAGGRQGAAVKVGLDGTVYVVWLDTVDKQVVERVSVSHDGGKTFPRQNVTVASVSDDFVSPVPGSSFRQDARTFPSLTVASDGTVYVAWGNRTGDPTNGHAVVLVTKSTDDGLTWSTPVVAGDVSGRSAYFASVTTDPSGTVSVAFNALDDVATGTAPGAGVVHFDTYLTQSTNGGASFTSPLKISTATSDPDGSSTFSLRHQFLGDYITAIADAAHVYVVWTDTRAATPCSAVDAFRAGTAGTPDVITSCANTFGNTDIFLGIVS